MKTMKDFLSEEIKMKVFEIFPSITDFSENNNIYIFIMNGKTYSYIFFDRQCLDNKVRIYQNIGHQRKYFCTIELDLI